MLGLFKKDTGFEMTGFILSVPDQIKAWRKANRKMKWGIGDAGFSAIGPPPSLTPEDSSDGFTGVILSHGFGNDGR